MSQPALSGSWILITSSVAAVWGTISGSISDQTDLQTQLNLKAPAASPTFTGTIGTPLTASRVLTTDGSGNLAASSVTSTVLSYLDVSSSINTLLGAKVGALAAVGSSPNANGASISGSTLTLQPADGSNPGVITTSAQTLGAGTKTIEKLFVQGSATSGASGTYLQVGGTSAVAADAYSPLRVYRNDSNRVSVRISNATTGSTAGMLLGVNDNEDGILESQTTGKRLYLGAELPGSTYQMEMVGGAATSNMYTQVNFPVIWATTSGKPTCNSSWRGATYYTRGGAGVADTFEICRKDASDAYAWTALY